MVFEDCCLNVLSIFWVTSAVNAKIVIHHFDSGLVENGDMFWNRKKPNAFIKLLAQSMFKKDINDRFTLQILLEGNQNLSEFGINASVPAPEEMSNLLNRAVLSISPSKFFPSPRNEFILYKAGLENEFCCNARWKE